MYNFVKATLVGRITKDGLDLIKETVPIGKQYEVLPESITKGLNYDTETKKTTPLQLILSKNDETISELLSVLFR